MASRLVEYEHEKEHDEDHDGRHHEKGHDPGHEAVFYYHGDHLGSNHYITDERGRLHEHLEYFPFGEQWVEEGEESKSPLYRFTAKELDPETGLYYFGARYYDPRTSVWIGADPILEKYLPDLGKTVQLSFSGVPNWIYKYDMPGIGGVFNSGNMNLYAYTHLNPLIYTDPDGQFTNPLKNMELRGYSEKIYRPDSSRFGLARRTNPDGSLRPHMGVDLSAAVGTKVYASGPGNLIYKGKISGYGNSVVYKFKYKYTVMNFLGDLFSGRWSGIADKMSLSGKEVFGLAAHLSQIPPDLSGQIKERQIIGLTGIDGARVEPGEEHLHFEVLTQWPPPGKRGTTGEERIGIRIDPEKFFQGLKIPPEPKD